MSEETELPVPIQSRFRFGLPQLFYATALIASGLAMHFHTLWISLLVLLVWWAVYGSINPRGSILTILFPLAILIPISATLPAITITRGPHPGTQCLNQLRQVMLAVLNYESEHGEFPSDRIVTLADGTELRHSWRIEILPQLEEGALYDQYDFNEPWNGPRNSKLQSQMPPSFSCPSHGYGVGPPIAAGHTSYKLINGPGTAFEAGKKIGFADLADGSSNTIGLIEDNANLVNWMEPGDFTAKQAADAMSSITKETSAHSYETWAMKYNFGSNYVMLDGSSHVWPPQSKVAPGAFLIADGEFFDADVKTGTLKEIKYHVFVAPLIYLILIVLPAIFLFKPAVISRA